MQRRLLVPLALLAFFSIATHRILTSSSLLFISPSGEIASGVAKNNVTVVNKYIPSEKIADVASKYIPSNKSRAFVRPSDYFEKFKPSPDLEQKIPPWFSASIDKSQTVLLLSCSWDYVSVLANFFMFQPELFRRLDVRIICYDKKFADFYESRGGLCAQHERRGEKIRAIRDWRQAWRLRSDAASKLLARGVNVIFSDTDALWMKNPLWYLRPHIMGDVILSRGLFPQTFSDIYGASGCMGFAFFSGTPDVAAFFKSYIVGREDDQKALGNALAKAGRNFSLGISRKMGYQGSESVVYGLYDNRGIRFSLAFLPELIFTRTCKERQMKGEGLVVAHCPAFKRGYYKILEAKKRGLYKLPRSKINWKAVGPNNDGLSFVDWILGVVGAL